MISVPNRRLALRGLGVAMASSAAVLGLAACDRDADDVGAVEDLMREHGIIRRAILVFRVCAARLAAGTTVDAKSLQDTATLMRNFGEDYHERKLEEAYIFPALKKAGGPAADYVDVLIAQHNRGREITAHILDVTAKGDIPTADVESLGKALSAFELMYAHHAAREDTIVFPAWKATMSKHQLDEIGDTFEDIEKQTFGQDGFDAAVKQIGAIEETLGLADISQFTAPAVS